MERNDFIENRIDVVKNIYTLYSYAKSTVAEDVGMWSNRSVIL